MQQKLYDEIYTNSLVKLLDEASRSFDEWLTPDVYEIDARLFSTTHLEAAMEQIGKHYGGKLEGSNIDDVVEELFDEYSETNMPLTKFKIGSALRDHDLNSSENMRVVIDRLREFDVAIR